MGGETIRIFKLIAAMLMVSTGLHAQDAAPFRLAVPVEMIDSGFMKHLLPRFRFRTQIGIEPVILGASAEMEFIADGTSGAVVFTDPAGAVYTLQKNGAISVESGEKFAAFATWLQSNPGIAAIEGFSPEGVSIYLVSEVVEVAEPEAVIDGDVVLGTRLALVHCGRCHVVDERNRMGGIGSTPSFAAMRGRNGWADSFAAFWTHNPHPSFTQVAGVTEPFDPARPVHIAPVEITLDEIDAIVAFVATLTPKDLGRPVSNN